jgi:hypothetical protein
MRSVYQWKADIANADATFCGAERAAAVFILANLEPQRAAEDLANALLATVRLFQEAEVIVEDGDGRRDLSHKQF